MEIVREIGGQRVEPEELAALQISNEVLQAVFQEAWARLTWENG